MRLSSLKRRNGGGRYGATDGETLRDTSRARGVPDPKVPLAAGGVPEGGCKQMALSEVMLLPPVTRPCKILCIGLNHLPRIPAKGRDKPEKPSIFTRSWVLSWAMEAR